ncbi:MAG: methionine synthase [Nocardioides sp.]|uniref:methionine synthase n=1 Tax=Nocardioides sp. TaxID=35761 RepID=UPI003EFE634D
MTFATGVGSLPGEDAHAFDEAVRAVLGELGSAPGLPFLPELPGRGVHAAMTGRGLALVRELGVDLQPAGWRLTGTPATSGVDHRRAVSLLAQDLDALEEQSQTYEGDLKVQLTGPWTLAATVEKPRGDKVLSDHGARRELAQALAEGVRGHVADLRRRLRGVGRLVVQVDEPAMAAVAAGRVPTASGYGRHRTIDKPELTESLGWVLAAVRDAGAEPWVHACAPSTPWDLVVKAGAAGLVVDVDVLGPDDLDLVAESLEGDRTVVLGVLTSTAPEAVPTEGAVTDRVLRLLDMVGLDPDVVGARLGVSHGCGQAGAEPAWVRSSWTLLTQAARNL